MLVLPPPILASVPLLVSVPIDCPGSGFPW